MMRRIIYSAIILCFSLVLSSCATAPVTAPAPSLPVPPAQKVYQPVPLPPLRQDVFHDVAPGETLWRLGKMYDVPIKDIRSANHLKTNTLEKGQRLLIPDAAPMVPVVALYPSNKWKYIIIHHSATDEGNSLDFDKYHQKRGWEGIGYHFVIDNGTKGKEDGQIEVSPRWLKQEGGAHCKAGSMNSQGIGICLVGNFNEENVTRRQMNSLAYLVDTLRDYYHIPVSNIMGHSEVEGAQTDCPGKKFPWKKFFNELGSKE